MSKRSKVVLIILISLVLIVLLSFFEEEPARDNNLEEWEAEITNPNNQLDPLNERVGENVIILDVAQKIEAVINKVFSFITAFIEGVIDKIFIVIEKSEPVLFSGALFLGSLFHCLSTSFSYKTSWS